MAYTYFSRNGDILPASKAVVPLSDIAYSYGFGVYETVRVSNGKILFVHEHCQRLMNSAKAIGLDHPFSAALVAKSAEELVTRNKAGTCNLKILLVGGATAEAASLDILCLNPLFPDRKLYKNGVHVIAKELERPFPQAKTLNMLPSYLARREAKAAGAHDALLIDRHGCITEGTSTNFFALKDRTLFSPPSADILPGVTRGKVLEVARKNGFKIEEKEIKLKDIGQYEGLLLTGTSLKIMPIRSVDEQTWEQVAPVIRELMQAFDSYLHKEAAKPQA